MTGPGQNAWHRVSWNVIGSLFVSERLLEKAKCLLLSRLSTEEKGTNNVSLLATWLVSKWATNVSTSAFFFTSSAHKTSVFDFWATVKAKFVFFDSAPTHALSETWEKRIRVACRYPGWLFFTPMIEKQYISDSEKRRLHMIWFQLDFRKSWTWQKQQKSLC